MDTPAWLVHLRSNIDAWNEYLEWLKKQRQIVLEREAKSWDDHNQNIGAKKELDNLIHLSTIDQKADAQLKAYRGGSHG